MTLRICAKSLCKDEGTMGNDEGEMVGRDGLEPPTFSV
jgi:hypothetical protein